MDGNGSTEGGAMNEREIGERIALIESMMQAGRKSTEYWGWNFLLWGIAYLVAVAWSSFLPRAGGPMLAWPITMVFAVLLTIAIARRRTRNKPRTERSLHLEVLWSTVGSSIFIFAFPVALSGHSEPHVLMAGIETLLGVANFASGRMLRWMEQMVVGALWWGAAIASCFVDGNGIAYVFLAATLVCNIGFGIYLMIRESRDKARARGAAVLHA
jgi:hypothetical protein